MTSPDASKAVVLVVDNDNDGKADPGDVLRYSVTINNTGSSDATGVTFDDTLPANTTLVPGSIQSTPLAYAQSVTTNEDTLLAITLTGADADGDTLTFNVTSGAANGGLGGTLPNLTYNPNSNFNGSDSFVFQVCDTNSPVACDTATVNITVLSSADNPTAVNDTATVAEDAAATTIPVLGNDSDPENDPFTIASVTQPANGAVVITNGGADLTYQPNANYCNTPPGTTLDTFTYTLTPGSSTAMVSVTVPCVDDLPTAVTDAATVIEDSGANTINVLANDTDLDGGLKSIASVTQPANGAVAITGGGADLTYTPNADYCNNPPGTTPDTFSYTLNGGSVATVAITVDCANDPPIAVNDSATVVEDAAATTIDVLANDTDSDGGAKTIDTVTQPANGTVAVTNSGADLTYQPDANYCNNPPGTALDTFTYTLNGGSTATVTMTVTCVDDDPTAVNDAASVAEDAAAITIDVLANDTDPDGGAKSIATVTQSANGTVAITNSGADLTYQPNADYCNTPPGTTLDAFTYTLTPGGSTATVSVTVTCSDDPPTAVNDTASVAQDDPATTIDVLANDTDIDGGPKSIASITQPANGTVVITNGGADLTYQPNASYCNNPPGTTPDTFTYTLTPGGSTATVSVSVICPNAPPTAVNDAATVAEDAAATTIDVLANDTDTDGGPKVVTVVTQPANGTVVITNGGADLTYQPNANYCNTPPGTTLDTFTYTLNGGSTATVTVTVTCVNDVPVAVDDTATVAEDAAATAIDVLANDTDLENDAFTITSVTQPANGSVVITGGGTGLTYQPTANYCNDPPGTTLDTFTYTLTPGGDTATVSVTVTCVNDSPVAVDDSATVAQDAAATTISVLANDTDVENDPFTIDTVTQPANGTVVITNGGADLTYQPNASYCNTGTGGTPDTFTYTLTPGGDTATVSVTVTCADIPPVAVDDTKTVTEDDPTTAIDVLANDTDSDGGPKSIASVTQPANGVVVITGGGTGLTYQPNANYCNTPPGTTLDTFTYTLTPGGDTATVTVTVTCVDDVPVAVDDSATVAEDASATAIDVLANDTDVDAGAKSISAVTQPANGVVVNNTTNLTYQPNANYCNTPPGSPLDTFTYTLTPGGDTAIVSVTVTCVNDNPTAVNDAATVTEDAAATAINVLSNDSDIEGDSFTIASVTQPANGAVVITGGGTGLTYQPNANYCNNPPGSTPDTFTYTLTPGGSSATVSVTVTCVDDPPTAVNDAATVDEDSGANAIAVLTNDTDIDAGPKSIASVTQPANGTVVITGGGTGLTYAPNTNYCNNPPGSALSTFTYTLTPGGSVATVTVTVTCINDPPVADNESFDFIGNTELRVDLAAASTPHVLETTPSTLGVLDGDSDPVENDPIFVSAIVGCADPTAPFVCPLAGVGTVTMEANGRFSFLPEAGDTGTSESFQYTLSDGQATVNATVTLNRFERVWYVKNNATAGGLGRSQDPFDTLAEAQTASLANDYIFVYFGNGTTTGQASGIALKSGQHLIGEHAGLSLSLNLNGNGSPTNLVAAALGNRPLLDDTVAGGAEGVSATDVIPVEIVGLNLAGNVNALDWTTTAAFSGSGSLSIRDNVIRSAGAEGVDLNLAGTGGLNLAFHDNNLTATGTALDIQETGTGSLTITTFDDNVVTGNSGGSGININTARFDATPGGSFNVVSGGTTAIGASGNGVGGAGMVLTSVTGDLSFTDLDIYADGGAGLSASSSGAFNAGAGTGFRIVVGAGVSVIEATGGPAVNISSATVDLQLTSLTSTNSTTTGVSLDTVVGTFSAGSGSSISNATGTDFNISGGTANVTYNGTITDDVGQLVAIANTTGGTKSFGGAISDGNDGDGGGISLTNNTGATINFTGGLVLSTGTNPAFAATGGGTVNVTGAANTIATTTGTALNIANTTIGASGVTFRSISAGTGASGPTNGIVLNNTGSSGGLTVAGNGGSCTSAASCTGGAIQNSTGDAVSLNNATNVSLIDMYIFNSGQSHIDATNVTGLTLTRVSTDLSFDHGFRGNSVRDLTITGGTFNRGAFRDGTAALCNLDGFNITNLLGNSSITGATFMRSNTRQFYVVNNTATAFNGTPDILTVTNTNWNTHNVHPCHGDHLSVSADTNANFRLVVNATGGNNVFKTAGIAVQAAGAGGGKMDAQISGVISGGGLFTDANTAGVAVAGTATSNVTFNVSGNTTLGTGSLGMTFNDFTSGTFAGTIQSNSITHVAGPGTDALQIISHGDGNGAAADGIATIAVINNTISGDFQRGIRAQSAFGDGTLNLTVTGNTVHGTDTTATALRAIEFEVGGSGGGTTNQLCLDLASNKASMDNGNAGYRLFHRAGYTFQLENFSGVGTNATDVTNWVINPPKSNQNTSNGPGTVLVTGVANTFTSSSGCPTP